MTKIVLSRRAREDFKRIWSYIAFDSETAADRTLMAIDAKIGRLRSFPESGSPRDDIRPGARMIVHGSYLTLYDYDAASKTVEIVAIVEGMRDLERLF
ncbi:MAG TPA: type II toxin-antitoxin system RelE/ParE family toxin [Caulobacteraceae bacterium]|nr:type II toxin-antitoxin system RelE/ParE family toxin [Caulobacteraceae bacterium]